MQVNEMQMKSSKNKDQGSIINREEGEDDYNEELGQSNQTGKLRKT